MPFLNRTIVTKKLLNIIDTFSGKLHPTGYSHCATDIETKMQENISAIHSRKMFFSVQKNFLIEKWENLSFISFKE